MDERSTRSGSEVPAHPPIPSNVVAIVLAAGAGSRFTGPNHKLLTPLASASHTTIIESALANVLAAGFQNVIVVTGAVALPDASIRDEHLSIVHNEHWFEGQSSSLRTGIEAARAMGGDIVVVGLGDQPFIDPRAWRRVALEDSPIAIATYSRRQGHPVRLARSVWQFLPEQGDIGARDLIRMHPELVSQVDCPGSATDVDTQEDLDQWT